MAIGPEVEATSCRIMEQSGKMPLLLSTVMASQSCQQAIQDHQRNTKLGFLQE
jgi:hypothetical protein